LLQLIPSSEFSLTSADGLRVACALPADVRRRENAIMWDTPGIAQMRLRPLLASETVLAGLLLAGLPRTSRLIRSGGSPSMVILCGASRMAPSLPYQYCSNHRRVSLGNNCARVDAFRWSPVHAVAASPGTESAWHTLLGFTRLSPRQPLDRYHTRFGSLEGRSTANLHGLGASRRHIRNYRGRLRDNMSDSLWALCTRSAAVQHLRRDAALLREKGRYPRHLRPRVDSR
jgi:hypothetical protein